MSSLTLEESTNYNYTPATILSEGRIVDAYMTFEFIRRLVTPFEKTKAYDLGIIDAQGNLLKRPSTPEEKKAYSIYDRLVFNLRRILMKLPFGKTRLATFAAALFLLREKDSKSLSSEDDMYESFLDFLEQIEGDTAQLVALEKLAVQSGIIAEEPANGVAGIAGVGDNTVVVKTQPPKIRRKFSDNIPKSLDKK